MRDNRWWERFELIYSNFVKDMERGLSLRAEQIGPMTITYRKRNVDIDENRMNSH